MPKKKIDSIDYDAPDYLVPAEQPRTLAPADLVPDISSASVKVMRSYDYCHFEVSLSSDVISQLNDVDNLRKAAAVLADEAVRQYKVAKANEEKRRASEWEIEQALRVKKSIEAQPESEWTPESAAYMRKLADREFWKDHEEESYCYSDPEKDYHFSMLRRFQGVTVKP